MQDASFVHSHSAAVAVILHVRPLAHASPQSVHPLLVEVVSQPFVQSLSQLKNPGLQPLRPVMTHSFALQVTSEAAFGRALQFLLHEPQCKVSVRKSDSHPVEILPSQSA